MGQISKNVQNRARQYAKIMQAPYSQALADIQATPTAVRDGVIWQPLRSMERGEAAVIVGPDVIISPLVESIRDQLAGERDVTVFRLADYGTRSRIAEEVAMPVRAARSQAQIIAVIDDSPNMNEAREHLALAQFIPDAIWVRITDLRSISATHSHGKGSVTFADGPIYVFDGYGDPSNVTRHTITARDVVKNLRRHNVTVVTRADDAQEAMFEAANPDTSLLPPTVYRIDEDATGSDVLTAQYVAHLGAMANMGLLCTSTDIADRIGVPGTIIRTHPDGTTTITTKDKS